MSNSQSLRNRRMSEFPQQEAKNITLTQATFNLPELTSKLPQSLLPSSSVQTKPSVKRQQTYVRTAENQERNREKEKKKGDSRKSRVGEKIKKRLSMRYAEPSPSMPAPPVPMLRLDTSAAFSPTNEPASSTFGNFSFPNGPSSSYRQPALGLPGGQTSREEEIVRPRGSVAVREDYASEERTLGPRWDLEGLKDDKADVNTYIKKTLAGAEDDEIADFKIALADRKAENAKELKNNVFSNYAHFVTISKEIGLLENDMLELKEMLNEWKRAPSLLGAGTGTGEDSFGSYEIGKASGDASSVLERRKTVRNSVLNLENLYKNQVQALWTQIAGSQKFLPYAPGRHLICEASNFSQLDSATYKVKQSVELFLLNDLLLVAVRKRKRNEAETRGKEGKDQDRSKGRLVAERCWNLNEVVVVDVKDSGDLTNAIKIRRGKESLVYRTNFADDKRVLLAAFRKVAEDLAAKKRKASEKEQERRKSMWTGDMVGARTGDVPPLPKMPTSMSSGDLSGGLLDTFEDDLTMAIAVRDWDEAVALVKKGKKHLASPVAKALPNNAIAGRLTALSKELVGQLGYDLSNPDIKRSLCIKSVAYLVELDEAQLASRQFLAARAGLLHQRTRMIPYSGDVPAYISELGVVTFTVLKHTADWYLTAFRENRMISGLVEWAEIQVRHLAEVFRRQVYGPTSDQAVIDESLRITAHHNRKLLRDSGLDFTFLFATLLQPNWDDPHVVPNPIFAEYIKPTDRPAANRQATNVRYDKIAQPGFVPPRELQREPSYNSPKPPPRSERRARLPVRDDNNNNKI